MRVTQNMLAEGFMRNLSQNLRRLGDKQDMLSSTKKIRKPSDDPVGAALAIRLRRQLSEIEQYKSNARDALTWLKNSETSLTNSGNILHRIKELTIQAANGTMTKEDRTKVLNEVQELKEQLLHEVNSSYVDNYLYSGFSTDNPPFVKNDDGKIISNSDINIGTIEYNLGKSQSISINLIGTEVFEGIFENIEELETALENNETDKISDEILGKISGDLNQILKYRAQIGARTNRLEATIDRLDYNRVDYIDLLSQTVDVDIAEVIMELKMEESVYRASLAVGARIIQPTLTDFLR
jgi:flagellar hook-associated protein 3 FlgL